MLEETLLEIDHLFVMTSAGAPQARSLLRLGLLEGSRNRHPGQGTANRRFFFNNFMLELLWVEDRAAAASPAVRRTGLLERWSGRDTAACPFGVCLRPSAAGEPPPFETWDYRPPWLAPGAVIPVATCSDDVSLPLVFWLPFGRRPDAQPATRREPLAHRPGLRELSRVTLAGPRVMDAHTCLREVLDSGALALHTAGEHLLELVFDDAIRRGRTDLRPSLPLRLAW